MQIENRSKAIEEMRWIIESAPEQFTPPIIAKLIIYSVEEGGKVGYKKGLFHATIFLLGIAVILATIAGYVGLQCTY